MPNKFKSGDRAYIVENSLHVREVQILKAAGGFATLRFAESDSATRLRESKLFATRAEAEASLAKIKERRIDSSASG